jgi:purine-binding chemotaxis protein CheW
MEQLFLLTEIADTEIAINANCVESVVTIGDVIGVPRCHPIVAGLCALRSRVLTLIDCQYAITGRNQATRKGQLAVIASVSGQPYGLLVDAVRDVVSVNGGAVKPVSRLDPKWQAIAAGAVEIDNRMVLLLSAEMLIASPLALAA